MRAWSELRAALRETGPYGLLDLEPEEAEAVMVATVFLRAKALPTTGAPVPVSWSRARLNPAGCLVAAAMGTQPRSLARVLAEVYDVPVNSEVFVYAMRAAINDGLLRPSDPSLWSGRAKTRDEAVVSRGPRLIASDGEGTERWAPIW